MGDQLRKPDFDNGVIKLGIAEDEVYIYVTEVGLRKLMDFCNLLLTKSKEDHIHLEDFGVLTKDSLKGVMALFKTETGGKET
jgi:hypothetical protein